MNSSVDPETIATYDRVAARFHQKNGAMMPEIEDALTTFLDSSPEGPILDVGCGTGRDLAWMEGRGADVTGVDASRGMLAQAGSLVRGPLYHMHMRNLELAVKAYAGVWCNAALLHVPKEEAPAVLHEFRRVLVPDGALAFALQAGTGEGYEKKPYGEIGARFFARYSLAEAVGLAEAAGFGVIDGVQSTGGAKQWIHVLARKHA